MRMMKRAAVGILAAAMALSMLTACGGASAGPSTSGSTSTGGSGNPGSSSSSSDSSSDSNGGSSSSSSDSSSDSNGGSSSSSSSSGSSSTKFTYKDSLTNKYNLQRYNSKTWYEKTAQIDSHGGRNIYETALVFGSDHRVQKSYYKSSYSNGSAYESLMIDGTNYMLYRDAKIAITYKSNGSSSSSEGEIYRMDSIVKTTQKVNYVSYYTEVTTYKGDKTGKIMTRSYCFDTKGKLVYLISSENGQEFKTHILDYSTSIPGSVIMEIPSDWSVYTFDYTTTPKTVTDAAGNKLTEDEIAQLNKIIYKQ